MAACGLQDLARRNVCNYRRRATRINPSCRLAPASTRAGAGVLTAGRRCGVQAEVRFGDDKLNDVRPHRPPPFA